MDQSERLVVPPMDPVERTELIRLDGYRPELENEAVVAKPLEHHSLELSVSFLTDPPGGEPVGICDETVRHLYPAPEVVAGSPGPRDSGPLGSMERCVNGPESRAGYGHDLLVKDPVEPQPRRVGVEKWRPETEATLMGDPLNTAPGRT